MHIHGMLVQLRKLYLVRNRNRSGVNEKKSEVEEEEEENMITCDHEKIGTGPFYVIPDKF